MTDLTSLLVLALVVSKLQLHICLYICLCSLRVNNIVFEELNGFFKLQYTKFEISALLRFTKFIVIAMGDGYRFEVFGLATKLDWIFKGFFY